jgi:hypothetical protein
MDDWEPEEKTVAIETVTCYRHDKSKTVEVITGNSSTGALSCGHVYNFEHKFSRAPEPEFAVFHHGVQEVM